MIVAALWVLQRMLGDVALADVMTEFRGLSLAAVIAASLLTALSYVILTGYDLLAVRHIGRRLPYRQIGTVSFIAFGIGHTVGMAVASAGAVRYRLYSAAGLGALEIATIIGICTVSFGLGACLIAGLALLVDPTPAGHVLHVPEGLGFATAFALLAAVAAYLVWCGWQKRPLRFKSWTLPAPTFGLGVRQLGLAILDIPVAAAVLWVLLPADADVGIASFLVAFTLAMVAGITAHAPAGIGVFEAVLLLTLPEVRPEALLGSVLAFRCIYYFAPLAIGAAWLGLIELGRARAAVPSATAPLVLAPEAANP